MFKKILSILLSITLLLTLCPVMGVFAASEVGTFTEDFDDMATTSDYVSYNTIFASHSFFTNKWLDNSTSRTFNSSYASYKIVEKKGADGQVSKMLQMRSPNASGSKANTVGIGLPSFEQADYDAGKRFTYSFDFCLENIPDDASKLITTSGYAYLNMFSHHGSGGMYSNSKNFDPNNFVLGLSRTGEGSVQAKLTEGDWYRAEMVVRGNAATSGGTYLYYSIYDKDGTKLFTVSTGNELYLSQNSGVPRVALLAAVSLYPVSEENAGFTVLIDNAEYKVCLPASAGPAIKTGSTFTEPTIKSGDTVELNVGQVTVAFDQQLATGAKATLTPSGGTPIECEMTAGEAYANSSFYTVTIPKLTAGTDYTLSFDEYCKNSQNQPCGDSIAFKTAGGASEKAEVSNISFAGVASGNEITFDYLAKEAGETVFIAAFYDKTEDKNLVGAEILIKNDVVEGENKITITLENDYSDDAQNFVIYTWNNLEDITPLTDTVNTPIN